MVSRKALRIKGFASVVLMFAAVFALSACSASDMVSKVEQIVSKDPYTLYTDANNKILAAKGVKETININGTMSLAGMKEPIKASTDVKMNDPYTSAMEMAMSLDMSVAGQDLTATSYYKGGEIYTDAMGQKSKTKVDMAKIRSQTALVQFKKNDIINQKRVKTSSGTDLTFTIKGAALKDYVTSSLGDLGSALGSSVQYDIKDATVVAHLAKDGNMTNCKVTMPFALTMEGETVTANMTMEATNIEYGHQDITPPSDLSSYQDASEASSSSSVAL